MRIKINHITELMNFQKITTILSLLLLTACVTVTDSRFAKKADPDKAVESYVALGVGYLSSGDLIMARKKLDRALEIDPEYAAAHSAMAMYWLERGEPKLAKKEFLVALDLDEEHSPSNYQYGRYLLAVEASESACEYLQLAAEDVNYSARVLAYEDLGQCHQFFKKDLQAIDAYEKAWSLDANSTVATLSLAKIYLANKNLRQSTRWFARFEKNISDHDVPHNADSLFFAIQLAKAKRDRNALASYALKLKKRFPDSEEFKRFTNGR